ncbi:MAG: hypothetical protein IJN12_03505 [Clostridia bacterium]|nr:hypothetical protein [Clostridia bacterium]
MKCLNCGCENDRHLCQKCASPDNLNKLFNEIIYYRIDKCENPYLLEYVAGLEDKMARVDLISEISNYCDYEDIGYYLCECYRIRRDIRFENAAIEYLKSHKITDTRAQNVLYNLIKKYIPNDLIKAKQWCEIIAESDNLYCEIYAEAAKYFAMIGEYEMADTITEKAIELCNDVDRRKLLFYSPEYMISILSRQKEDTNKYRTKKPYWPSTEERRRVVAMFYDEKGINHPAIEGKPKKIKEDEFTPIKECFEDELKDYCTFWCSEAFSMVAAKPIYQIAAVKIHNGKIIDEFQSLIRPWDGIAGRKDAARKARVELSVIEGAEDVDQVMKKFFDFVGDDILVSTGALGNQAKLISRAARYTGMREIKNEFYDLLDLAADTSAEFDLANNTREYLLINFSITEGESALEKARINKQLYDYLMNYGN